MVINQKETNYVYKKVAPNFDDNEIEGPPKHHENVNKAVERTIKKYSVKDWVEQLKKLNDENNKKGI